MGKNESSTDGRVKVTSDELVDSIKLDCDQLGNAINELSSRASKYSVLIGKLAPLVSDSDLTFAGIKRIDLYQFLPVVNSKESE